MGVLGGGWNRSWIHNAIGGAQGSKDNCRANEQKNHKRSERGGQAERDFRHATSLQGGFLGLPGWGRGFGRQLGAADKTPGGVFA